MKRSDYRFGLTSDEWEQAKDQLRRAILAAAWERRMTHYIEAARAVTVTPVDPHSGLMSHLLGEIFENEHAPGRPALTSIELGMDRGFSPVDELRVTRVQFGKPGRPS